MNSRNLLYEAQQAHYYGLSANLALASVTSTPATILGYDHRIGYLKVGYDAGLISSCVKHASSLMIFLLDVVIWDSSPLSLGATPKQVFIDGISQLDNPHVVKKPVDSQNVPQVPDFDQEAENAVKYDGLPPLEMKKSKAEVVVFVNVHTIYRRNGQKIERVFSHSEVGMAGVVVTLKGEISCYGRESDCSLSQYGHNIQYVDLKGGSIS